MQQASLGGENREFSLKDKADVWEKELEGDPDRAFILTGICEGFRIIDDDAVLPDVEVQNYHSATGTDSRALVEKQIQSEIAEGRYRIVKEKPMMVSALGAVPKSDGGLRLIHDCSRPINSAVNDLATLSETTKYQSLDDAQQFIKQGSFLAKVDLKSAYRSVPVHPSNYQALGLKWHFSDNKESTYMYDTRLPFGAKLAPGIFNRITQAVRRLLQKRGIKAVVYLDDFLIVADTFEECRQALNVTIQLLRSLGFAISWNKVEGPSRSLVFLGILIDTIRLILELPSPKLEELKILLRDFASRRRASLRHLQSLVGKLNWACQVVRGGRVYLRRMLDFVAKLKRPYHKALIPQTFKDDVRWWLSFLDVFHGKCFAKRNMPIFDLATDASSKAIGAHFRGDWAYLDFETDLPCFQHTHINYKEVFALVVAAELWAPSWADSKLYWFTDSKVAQGIVKKGTCKDPMAMNSMRRLFWLSAIYNFEIVAIHIPGVDNEIPDAISRLNEYKQWQRLETLLGGPDLMLPLASHISDGALALLSPQVERWCQRRLSWKPG